MFSVTVPSTMTVYEPITVPSYVLFVPTDYTRTTINAIIASKIKSYSTTLYNRYAARYPHYNNKDLVDLVCISLLLNEEKILSQFEPQDRDSVLTILHNLEKVYQ